MSTIGFTNRERIMISDDKNQFLEYLALKLPPSDYTYHKQDFKDAKLKGNNQASKKNFQHFPTEESTADLNIKSLKPQKYIKPTIIGVKKPVKSRQNTNLRTENSSDMVA